MNGKTGEEVRRALEQELEGELCPTWVASEQEPAARVLVAVDDTDLLQTITTALSVSPEVTVVGETTRGKEVFRMAWDLAPDIVLLDIWMPQANGLVVTEMICTQRPGTRVLAVSENHSPDLVIRAIRAGAAGYLVKDASAMEVLDAIQAVLRGDRYFSSRIAADVTKFALAYRTVLNPSVAPALKVR